MQQYIYGAGGHGKVVLDAMLNAGMHCDGFVDDRDLCDFSGFVVLQVSHVTNKSITSIHLAIGNNKTRVLLAEKLFGMTFFNVLHPLASIAKSAKIGSGCLLAAHSVIGPDAVIGDHCIVNHAAVVDHDCVVGDFSHIAPQAGLGGGVRVGKGVLIGAGAIVLPGISVADYSIVGAGAVVTKNVPAGVTVVGNPAKQI